MAARIVEGEPKGWGACRQHSALQRLGSGSEGGGNAQFPLKEQPSLFLWWTCNPHGRK